MDGEFFTDFKSSNGIEISWKLKVLLNFKWFQGSTPLGGGRWVDGGGDGYECVWGIPCTHMHTYAHTCMHVCTCMLNMLNMLNMDASMSAAICNFYTCINVHVCMCMHVHACACMCVCVGTPPMPPDTPPPTCSLPRAVGSPKHQNSISPELIKIIRFCLKILYLWTYLNSYRL